MGLFTSMRILLRPLHHWVWRDAARRARKLLRFAETEADGGRDLARAAEVTGDPVLRRLYLSHASDEKRHAELFRRRGLALLGALPDESRPGYRADWLAPGERGLDDLRVEETRDGALLAFLHLSEKSAAADFACYRDVLGHDQPTSEVFREVLQDEVYHVKYTLAQLARVSPQRHRWLLWRARFGRLWKGYLRLATGVAGLMGTVMLTAQYFVLLPVFAVLAQRAARREAPGWVATAPGRNVRLGKQY
jgi:hypothetical protein